MGGRAGRQASRQAAGRQDRYNTKNCLFFHGALHRASYGRVVKAGAGATSVMAGFVVCLS